MLSVTLAYQVTTEINRVIIQNTEQYFMIPRFLFLIPIIKTKTQIVMYANVTSKFFILAGFPIKKSLKFKAMPTIIATIDKTIVAVILFFILLPPLIPKFAG
jgi:hypothetical protein